MDGLARLQGSCSDGQGTCSAVNDYAFVFFVSFKTERKKSIRKTYFTGLCPQGCLGDADDREGKSQTHLTFQWCLWKAANRKKQGIQHLPPFPAFSKKGEHFSPWAIWEAGSRVPFCKTRPSTMQWEPGAPWRWERRRKAGRRKRGSRSYLGLGGKALDLSCIKHKVAKPIHCPWQGIHSTRPPVSQGHPELR